MEAAAQLTPPVTQSAAPKVALIYFIYFFWVTLAILHIPAPLTHCCGGNTSSGRIVRFIFFIQSKLEQSHVEHIESNSRIMHGTTSLCR